jgi:hypothetical protein
METVCNILEQEKDALMGKSPRYSGIYPPIDPDELSSYLKRIDSVLEKLRKGQLVDPVRLLNCLLEDGGENEAPLRDAYESVMWSRVRATYTGFPSRWCGDT